ncbi:MAG: sugar phosphate isomerase/epimerase [Kiritimatiellaeota bacterium]|nr:sugar phosphate isomerase/epimerase [Kiritimatiellota bacterium]
MKRREFLAASAVAGVAAVCGTQRAAAQVAAGNGMPKLSPPEKPAQLNLCLQWGMIPGGEMNQKLDFLEANGYGAVEIPTGGFLLNEGEKFAKAMEGRKLFVATACGGSNFAYAEKEKRDKEVESFLPQIEVLGAIKSVGLIICPARGQLSQEGWLSGKDLRRDFVENTGKRMAEHAAKHGTSIVLEPLRRNETPFLRQVADGATIARDIGPGASVMGDFWHMALEETSFMGAFISAGKLLTHVHIASLKRRQIPGVDGEADNYVDGFKGLKMIGYRGAVSLEGGVPRTLAFQQTPDSKEIEIKDKDGRVTEKGYEVNKELLLANMQRLLREQWEQA